MKLILIGLCTIIAASCNFKGQNKNLDNDKSRIKNNNQISFRLILPNTFEFRRIEFLNYVNTTRINISDFALKHGWDSLTNEEFMDSVMIFDDKNSFNKTLLIIAGADTSMKLPETYCAALEKRTLVSVSPEYYSKVYPEGIEENSFIKLLTHEMAHRLHVRILGGDEEAMGPIWFYEGFAIYVADQFSKSNIILSKEEMIRIMKEPERGSYLKYNYLFRYFAKKIPIRDLILRAKNKDFNEELFSMLD